MLVAMVWEDCSPSDQVSISAPYVNGTASLTRLLLLQPGQTTAMTLTGVSVEAQEAVERLPPS
jgi:hypothetical protein